MTGPGRSPSSPWLQNAQGNPLDGRTAQPFRPTLSPSNVGMQMNNSFPEQTNSNYFENVHDSPSSNPGTHAQKNWGSMPHAQSSLPSQKLQLYSQESASEGLANLLKTESDLDKGRRETAFQRRPSNGGVLAIKKNGNTSPSIQGSTGGHGSVAGKSAGSLSQGSLFYFRHVLTQSASN